MVSLQSLCGAALRGALRASIVLVALTLARPAFAIEGAAYLKTVEGARSAGLAGSLGAIQGTPESLWYNPAGLVGLPGVQLDMTHMTWANAFDSDHVVLGAPLSWRQALGLLYHRNGVLDMGRDNQGKETGNFEISQSVLGLGYAFDLGFVTLGASVKQLSETIATTSASSTAFDLGLLSEFSKDQVLLGLAVQNLGNAPVLGDPGAAIDAPLTLRASSALAFSGDYSAMRLMGDYRYLGPSARSAFSMGLEYTEDYQQARLAFRGGWDFGRSTLGALAGLGLGFGLGWGPVGMDYAWSSQDALGSAHRVSLTLLWDQRAKEEDKAITAYLGDSAPSNPIIAATPTPGFHVSKNRSVAGELEALLAVSPTPHPNLTPTPVVGSNDRPQGILGAIAGLFSWGKRDPASTEPEIKKEPKSLLKSVFNFFGIQSNAPNSVSDSPDRTKEDSFQTAPTPAPTPNPMQLLKGDSAPQPSPQPTPMLEKVKNWIKL